jgi:hypothetical protein
VPYTTVFFRTGNANLRGLTGADGSLAYSLLTGTYAISAYNRTIRNYSIKENVIISGSTSLSIETPVQCKGVTGSAGGTQWNF